MMKSIIRDFIGGLTTKRFSVVETEKYVKGVMGERYYELGGYSVFHAAMTELIAEHHVKPVGKAMFGFPSLHAKYAVIPRTEAPEKSEFYALHWALSLKSYYHNAALWEQDRRYIHAISAFLHDRSLHPTVITANERSLKLFHDEKWLVQKGKPVLQRLGITLSDLHCEETNEPFFYLSWDPTPKNALIVENKDTFHTCKGWIGEHRALFGIPFEAVIYGEGDKIHRSFAFAREVWPSCTDDIVFYYIGDLDPKGIWIYDKLASEYPFLLRPFVPMYQKMLEMREAVPNESSRRLAKPPVKAPLLQYLSTDERSAIERLFSQGLRIPQEAISKEELITWHCKHPTYFKDTRSE
ncbi:hypothetical protein EB820_25130 [Brevibacillus agri]|uniref:Wadjet protein JetD C-terminal domain-containing protein n=2 Tax=Brevibacillus agri TaxID=51101 RepID=A0A3M8A6P7_9BACL|nr:hypothetical protein BA6348_03335 [Brevibacillus agri]RNB46357.1 hypothetical protein EB820_25130 [Brevibacillus agri]